jgi:nuclear receptor subfamily 5 group A protein 3
MRGGRNKFGPMYKRDRARKLQMMRQRQIAVQTIRGSHHPLGEGVTVTYGSQQVAAGASPFPNLHIKEEIQIPHVSSVTSSPDSSPSPNAAALGQVSAPIAGASRVAGQQPALHIVGGGSGSCSGQAGTPATGTLVVGALDTKLWAASNPTTPSPRSLSPKSFPFDGVLPNGASSGSAPSAANAGTGTGTGTGTTTATAVKFSPILRDFVQTVDDREWQKSLFDLLQSQTYNQCEVDLFELMCKVLDQNLFSQVDWARNSVFFKDLKVGHFLSFRCQTLLHSFPQR